MDLKKKLIKKLSKKDNNKIARNDMRVFSSDEDDNENKFSTTSLITCSTSSTVKPDIILHTQPRLVNSMSIDSDSDSGTDFVAPSTQHMNQSSLLSQKKSQTATASKCKIKTLRKNPRIQQTNSSQQSTSKQKLNVDTPKTRIKTINDVPVTVNSAVKNSTEKNIQRKPGIKRNLFEDVPSTNTETPLCSENQQSSQKSTPKKGQKINIISDIGVTLNSAVKPEVKRNLIEGVSNTNTGTQTGSESQQSSQKSTPKKGQKINIISDIGVTLNSAVKPEVKRNLIEGVSNTNTGTQTGSECQESNTDSISCSRNSTDNKQKNAKVQTEQDKNKEVTHGNSIITCNVNLKRPHNVATQTDIDVETTVDSSSEEEIAEKVVKRKIIPMQVSPPKRLKTIDEHCSSSQKRKVEDAKVNLTSRFQSNSVISNKNSEKCENMLKKSNSTVKNSCIRSPMKQLTIPELNFCEKRMNQSAKTTPSTSPVKSTPSTSPAKSDKPKKSPEKKETRYTKESHSRVFETVKKIVDWVFENNYFSILFTKSETDLLKKLFDLPDRRLTIICIRLYTRQHRWHNLSNLCEELNLTYDGFNLKEFYLTLTSGFVNSDYTDEKIELLLDYLTLPDIKNICRSFKIRILSKKKDMINKLLEYSKSQCTLTSLKRADQILRDRVSNKLGICVKLKTNVKDIFFRIHLLYSLTNPDLETANDIYNLMYKIRSETIKYPKVNIDFPQLFSDRQDFLKFVDACVLRQEFYDTVGKKDIASAFLLCVEAHKRLTSLLCSNEQLEFDKKKPMFLRRFSAAWIYCKVLSAGSENLGKSNSESVCNWLTDMIKQEIYCVYKRGLWYSQLALVTRAHKKNIVGEVQSIIDGLSDKYVNEVQKHDLSIRGSKIRKIKISQMLYDQLQCALLPETEVPISRTIQATVVHNNVPGKKLQFVRTTAQGKEYSSVEETAINYYTTEDNFTHGIHCEGQLLEALFFILFWDILYCTKIPNTFITELQNRPLDLFSTEFYSNRTDEINTKLKNIRDEWSLDYICEYASKIYSQHTLELKSIVSFDFVEEDTFHVIIRSIGKKVLAAIFERFARDYKQFHSGLPDLFLWNYKELKCCFVEVKSENDKLSTKQILWINYLHKFGAKVEVCHVQHIGSRSTKKCDKQKQKKDE